MKWKWCFVVAILATGLTIGCGPGDDGAETNQENQNDATNQNNQTNNDNQNNQNNQNTGNNDGEDEFADAVDVWIGTQIANEDEPTPLTMGQTFGGRYENPGTHYFSVELEAGDLLVISSEDFEADLDADLEAVSVAVGEPTTGVLSSNLERFFLPEEHGEREFFAPESGTYTIAAEASAGDEMGFSFHLDSRTADVSTDLEVPGTTQGGDLDDAAVDVFEVSVADDTHIDVEVFAERAPVSSNLDAWLYIVNADTGEPVFDSSSQAQDVADPRLVFEMQGGVNYWFAIDMVFNTNDTAYEVVTEFVETSPDAPQTLSVGGVDSFDGTILERQAVPYFDYFEVSVEPGEYRKVTVEGADELEPIMVIRDTSIPAPPVNALAIDNVAGATLGVADDAAQGTTFLIQLTDQRNLGADVDTFHGGSNYDYTISVESAAITPTAIFPGSSGELSADTPGDIEIVDVTVADGYLLWLDSGSDTVLEDGQSRADAGFLPTWALGDTTTLARPHLFEAYYWSVGESLRFYLRDDLFRGGNDYTTTARMRSFDVDGKTYSSADLDSGNESMGTAATPSLPVSINGEFVDDGSDEADSYYFEFNAGAGDFAVATLDNATSMDTELVILDDAGEEVARSDRFMGRYQQQGQTPFDAAVVFEPKSSGQYYLVVEQFCDSGGFQGCHFGEVTVQFFVD